MSRFFLTKKGEAKIDAYGETPLSLLEIICREANLKAQDTFFELGCGRGRACFWLAMHHQVRVVGIDFVPGFINRAARLQKNYQLNNLSFFCEDLLKSDFSEGTIFYLYGTGFESNFLRRLARKLSLLPQGTVVITVSYPLSDYLDSNCFLLTKVFEGQFFWGKAEIFVQERIPR